MCPETQPAEVFAPGDFLREELEARGWTQQTFADILGRPAQAISEIVNGKKQITPETAIEIGKALDTSPELWLGLEAAYRLSLRDSGENGVQQRAELHSLLPLTEMRKKGWLTTPRKADIQETRKEVLNFMGVRSLDKAREMRIAARRSCSDPAAQAGQLAWACRVRNLAAGIRCEPYTACGLRATIRDLVALSRTPEGVLAAPQFLAARGVRLVFVPHLTGTRIDGAALWQNRQPIIGLSLRYPRIDHFWFTLLHEVAHVVSGHHGRRDFIDDGMLSDEEAPEVDSREEEEANQLAANWLIPPETLLELRDRHPDRISAEVIHQYSDRLEIHPGILVGRLQYQRWIEYHTHRKYLVNVRKLLQQADMLDCTPRLRG
ncbi:MAG: HigA family addiction module antitoxin [Phycisphaerae bacterium]